MKLRLSTAAGLLILGLARTAHADPITPDTAPPAKRMEICIATFEEAQLKQRRGDFANARKLYTDCSSTNCPAQLRADCVHARSVVDQAVATASFVVRDADGKELPAKIKIDGVALESAGTARPIDAGEHDVEYTLADGKTAQQKVVIHEGEKSRVVVLAAPAPPPPPPAPPPAPCPPVRVEAPRSLVGPLILAGAGALTLIGAFGAYVVGKGQMSERDRLKQELATQPQYSAETVSSYNDAIEKKNDAATTDRIVAIALGGAGVLCLAGAAVWFLAGRPAAKSAWHVLPQLGPSTAGATFGASF